MKHLRKSILTLLALTLFGGAGAWAQQEVLLTTVTATGQTTYSQSPDGIVTVTLNIGFYDDIEYGWLGGTVTVEAPQGYTITRCVFRQNDKTPLEDDLAPFTATLTGVSTDNVSVETSTGHVNGDADHMIGITSIEVYGYAADQAIELTKLGDNQWTLGQTPDYDLELQVEYYQKYALKDIPAGWTVMVNGVDKTAAIDGDSLLITETDSVTLVPTDPRRVKSVTLVEPAPAVQTITIDGITLDITGCTTWADIIARNPGVIWDDDGWIGSGSGILLLDGDAVYTSDTYNPSAGYYWGE